MQQPEMIFSVSELNEYVSALLSADPNLRSVRVRGEISGFKRHSSGHLYFSLKDANAVVQCVMFRQYAIRMSFRPEDGQARKNAVQFSSHKMAAFSHKNERFT